VTAKVLLTDALRMQIYFKFFSDNDALLVAINSLMLNVDIRTYIGGLVTTDKKSSIQLCTSYLTVKCCSVISLH